MDKLVAMIYFRDISGSSKKTSASVDLGSKARDALVWTVAHKG